MRDTERQRERERERERGREREREREGRVIQRVMFMCTLCLGSQG